MWHTMILFVASQASQVCFQMQKSDDFHGCNIIWFTNTMLMSTTVHCTNTHSFLSLNFQLLKLQWTVTERCTGFPMHTTAAAVAVTQCLLMASGWQIHSHCPGTKGEVSLTASAFCYTTQLTHCAPALPAPAHTLGTARKREEELQKNKVSEAQHPHASSFCSQQLTALSMRPL